jgi:hypothetical protein
MLRSRIEHLEKGFTDLKKLYAEMKRHLEEGA